MASILSPPRPPFRSRANLERCLVVRGRLSWRPRHLFYWKARGVWFALQAAGVRGAAAGAYMPPRYIQKWDRRLLRDSRAVENSANRRRAMTDAIRIDCWPVLDPRVAGSGQYHPL